ncbi:MAG TPA: hypothetical protein VD996_02160 [Chitinophagaceae bacterium]|nr:hypothetical protein [Chitinophagaceae bacterium]
MNRLFIALAIIFISSCSSPGNPEGRTIGSDTLPNGQKLMDKDRGLSIATVSKGNGLPATYQLIDRKTGSNLLGQNIEASNIQYLADTLFAVYYQDKNVGLYNATSGKHETFKLPDGVPRDIYIDLKHLDEKVLVIGYTRIGSDEGAMLKFDR